MSERGPSGLVRQPESTGDGLVQIGYLHSHTVSYSWHESFTRLIAWDAGHEGRLIGTAGPIAIRCDTASIPESRNLLTQMMLDNTPHEWLFMTDTDMGFAPDSVDRLIASADPVARPVVGGLCFAAREVASDGMGGRKIVAVPTLFDFRTDTNGVMGFANRLQYVPGEVTQVAGTGGAFLLIHRSVLEKVRAEHGDHWFSQIRLDDGRQISEDLSFCARVGKLGWPIYVDTAVKTTHHKSVFISEDDYHMNAPIEQG